MDSHETHEPSYYEVALTNRQVLIAFVALLTCLLVAFLSGVWIGRGGAEAAQLDSRTPAQQAAAVAEPPLEQLSFFNGTDPGKSAPKAAPAPSTSAPVATAAAEPAPDAPRAAAPPEPAPDASDAMRQNLEATMAANRETPAMKLAVGERTGTAPADVAPQRAAADAAAPAKTAGPAPSKTENRAPAAGRIYVQVYSSNNAARAREILAQLRQAGFAVVMAETAKGGGKSYRVRVGPYDNRAAADAAAIRLRRDHRLDTWVTDSP